MGRKKLDKRNKKEYHSLQDSGVKRKIEINDRYFINVEKIKEIKRGDLKKRNKFFVKQTRTFVLTNEPRIKYYKNKTELRGEVLLTPQVEAVYIDKGTF